MDEEKDVKKDVKKELTPWQIEHQKYMNEKGEKASWEKEEEPKPDEEEEKIDLELEEETKTSDKPKEEKPPKEETPEQEEKEEERKSIAHELPKMKKSRNKKLIRRLSIITGISLTAILIMSYQISPLSRLSSIDVEGAANTEQAAIISGSKLQINQSVWGQFFNRGQYQKNIIANNVRVETAKISLAGINSFHIKVTEYTVKGYEKEAENKYLPILASGAVLTDEPVNEANRNQSLPILLNFQDRREQIANLFVAFNHLPEEMQAKIRSIQLHPSGSNPDLVRISMDDGNLVIVSIEDIVDKMEYYQSVASQLTEPSVIDMEVGIFSYPMDMLDRPIEKVDNPDDESDDTEDTGNNQ